MKAKENH